VVAEPATAPFLEKTGLMAVPFEPKVSYRLGMFRPSVRTLSRTAVAFMDRFRVALEPDRTSLG
jgi:hypothetical protein